MCASAMEMISVGGSCEAVEYFKDMGVRSMKTAGNGLSRLRKIFENKNEKYVRSVSNPAILAD